MTMGDEHEQFVQQIAAYALDAVSPEDRAQTEAHLTVCPACATLLDEYRSVAGLLPLGLPAQMPPAETWQQIAAQVRHRQRRAPPGRAIARWLGLGLSWQRLAASTFASAAFVVLLAILVSLAFARADEAGSDQVQTGTQPAATQAARRTQRATPTPGVPATVEARPSPDMVESTVPEIVLPPPSNEEDDPQPDFDTVPAMGSSTPIRPRSATPQAATASTPRPASGPASGQLGAAAIGTTPAAGSRTATRTPTAPRATATPIPPASVSTRTTGAPTASGTALTTPAPATGTATAAPTRASTSTPTSTPRAIGTPAAIAATAQPVPCGPVPTYSGTGPTPIPPASGCSAATAAAR
jgi:anti-sigma factor RsiW